MAFITIATDQIEAGDPVTQELWTKTKDNFDDHEARLTVVEAGFQKFLPIRFICIAAHYKTGSETGLAFVRVPFDITITNGSLFLIDSGTSGTLTVDVQASAAGGGAFSSIFTVKPTLTSAAADFAVNSGTLDGTKTSRIAGDILRFDVSSYQVGNFEFQTLIDFETA